MQSPSAKPLKRHITAVLVAQIQALDTGDARRIEKGHRAVRLDDDPAFRLALAHLERAGRAADWQEAQFAIWIATCRRDLPQRVRYAAYDAALALLTRDLLDATSFAQLYGPWAGARDEHVLVLD